MYLDLFFLHWKFNNVYFSTENIFFYYYFIFYVGPALYLEPEMVPSPASYMELQNGSI